MNLKMRHQHDHFMNHDICILIGEPIESTNSKHNFLTRGVLAIQVSHFKNAIIMSLSAYRCNGKIGIWSGKCPTTGTHSLT